jgi:ribosomal protein S18 acetylase RimI-like enzyme
LWHWSFLYTVYYVSYFLRYKQDYPVSAMHTPIQWDIRSGTVQEASTLAELGARTFSQTYGSENTADNMEAHLARSFGISQQTRELADPEVKTLMAYSGNTLLGYAQVRRGVAPDCVIQADPVELHRIYVDSSAHGQGLAQTLMRAARGAALELGGQHLWLGVWEQNPRALAFYKKVGFGDVGFTDFVVGTDRQRDRVLVTELVPDDADTR